MKLLSRFIVSSFCCCFAAALVKVHAQSGTVNFSNGAAQVNAPVLLKESGLGAAGPDWKIELLVQSSSNQVSIAGPVPFESGSLAGYFFAGSIAVPNTAPGESATFKLRVFNGISEFSVESEPITVTLGGGIAPPANLLGLTSLQVPSPVRLSIAKGGEQIILSWPKEASNMLLQSSGEFSATWQNITAPKSTNATSVSVTLDILTIPQLFRLASF